MTTVWSVCRRQLQNAATKPSKFCNINKNFQTFRIRVFDVNRYSPISKRFMSQSSISKLQTKHSMNPLLVLVVGALGGAGIVYTRMRNNSSNDSNPLSTSSSNDKYKKGWKLYYWPTIGGRGMYARMIFLLANIEWEEPMRPNNWKAINNVRGVDSKLYPNFAPPMVTHNNELLISQTLAIVLFLSKQFNLIPKNEIDEAHSLQLALQIIDVLNEAEMAYHPIARHTSYKSQIKEAEPYIKKFVNERLPKHLNVLQNALKRNNNGNGWFFGDKVTYIDAFVSTFMRGYETSQQERYENDEQFILLKEHRKRFESIKRIGDYLNDPNKRPPIDDNSFMG